MANKTTITTFVVYSFWFIAVSWVFFCPIWAFHGTFTIGILSFLVINGEYPDVTGGFMWNGYLINFYWGRLAITITLWLLSVLAVLKFLIWLDQKPGEDPGEKV